MGVRMMGVPGALLLGLSAGCAGVPADGGRDDVRQRVAEHGWPAPLLAEARAFTDAALAEPLVPDTAVQLALLNNPELRRHAAALGFAAAEIYEAGRQANPRLSWSQLSGDSSVAAGQAQLTLGVAVNFVELLMLPANRRLARENHAAVKLELAALSLELAAEVEAAWYEAVAAEQRLGLREAAASALQASAELAGRYHRAGNLPESALALERAAASQAALLALTARAQRVDAESALNRLMGLDARQAGWTLAGPLDAPPDAAELPPQALQQLAYDSRLDLQAARQRAAAWAARHDLVRNTRWVAGIELGAERERDYDGALNVGPTLELELPLFAWGKGRVVAAQAMQQQLEAELDARVIDVSNDVARLSARLQLLRGIADEYRDALLPARETVRARMQEQQNYMLIGVFELLAARQQEYEAYAGYIDAVRDYWIGRSALSRAVGRRLPLAVPAPEPEPEAESALPTADPAAEHDHHHHH